MLFLFNSAARNAYLENIFSTLSLPIGSENYYQYRFDDDRKEVDISAMTDRCVKGEQVLISFIDRNAKDQIKYIPVRFGKLNRCELVDGRIYYYIKLLNYCHAKDEQFFSLRIVELFNKKVYQQNNDAWIGALALRTDSADISDVINCDNTSWITTVKRLSCKEVFKNYHTIFTRIEIKDSKGSPVEVRKIEDEYFCKLTSQHEYSVCFSYFVNEHKGNPTSKLQVTLSDPNNILSIAFGSIALGNKQGYIKIPIDAPKIDILTKTSILLSSEDNKTEKALAHFEKPLKIAIFPSVSPAFRNCIIIVCFILLALSTWISSLPVNDIISEAAITLRSRPLSFYEKAVYNLCLLLGECKYFYNAICSVMISLSTFGLIHFYGKSKL